ncbi:MAG: hypothetical protein JWM67_2081, partial [Mycobacterium sp.]|nr:hypothetical protein [Mycobacterium sp.]
MSDATNGTADGGDSALPLARRLEQLTAARLGDRPGPTPPPPAPTRVAP